MRTLRRFMGVAALIIALILAGVSVFGGFSMSGIHAGLVIFCGLGGMFLSVS